MPTTRVPPQGPKELPKSNVAAFRVLAVMGPARFAKYSSLCEPVHRPTSVSLLLPLTLNRAEAQVPRRRHGCRCRSITATPMIMTWPGG
jgi:hypothetical protein